jgi:hypothetical protein
MHKNTGSKYGNLKTKMHIPAIPSPMDLIWHYYDVTSAKCGRGGDRPNVEFTLPMFPFSAVPLKREAALQLSGVY